MNKKKVTESVNRQAWIFIIPSILLIISFVFYPMIQAFITSFQTGTGTNLSVNGIDNYKRLLTDCSNGFLIYAGLWYDYDSSIFSNLTDRVDFLPDAEAICSRYDRLGEGIAVER